MIRIEREVRVERPRAEVFAYLTDPDRLPEWQASALDVTGAPGDGGGAGARWRETRVFMGKRIEQTVETTRYEPVEEFAVEVVEGPIPLRVLHRLTETEQAATLISVTAEAEPRGRFRFGARLIVPIVERQLDEDFARLRAIVEAGS